LYIWRSFFRAHFVNLFDHSKRLSMWGPCKLFLFRGVVWRVADGPVNLL
jgi:hypothetical protein